jgi:hypothetical protein
VTAGEEPLPGGLINRVVRVGDAVRRGPTANAPYVHALLRFLEDAGWPAAPRLLGVDDRGRELLGYVEGHAAWAPEQPPDVWSDRSLARAATLVRELHDLTAGTPLAAGGEVVCHNDLNLKNVVFRDLGAGLEPVAFLDWDLAGPGERVHDVAFLCWQFAPLGPGAPEVAEAARRMRVATDAYGFGAGERAGLVDAVLWWQDRTVTGIEGGAAAGDPAMQAIVDAGLVAHIRQDRAWTAANRGALRALLR